MQHNDLDNLMAISTYKFENTLRLLGLQLKHGYLPLEQVSRRIIEKYGSKIQNANRFINQNSFVSEVEHESKNSKNKFRTVHLNQDCTISIRRKGDSWFLTNKKEIVKMQYAEVQENNEIIIYGQKIKQNEPFFKYPMDSSIFDIYCSKLGEISTELHMYSTKSIVAKMMCLPIDDDLVLMPILDSLETLKINI